MRNKCSSNGHVVGLSLPLPTDPSDYCIDAPLGTVGCNNLHCHKCDVAVRNAPGLELKKSSELRNLLKQLYNINIDSLLYDADAYLKHVYDLPDISKSPLVQASSSDRLYLCRCRYWTEVAANSLDTSDPTPTDPNVPWSCASHP